MSADTYILNPYDDFNLTCQQAIQAAVHATNPVLLGIPSGLLPGLKGAANLGLKSTVNDDNFKQLKDLCHQGKLQLIDCGFSGAHLDLLPVELSVLEQKWGDTNPFGSGYSDLGLQKFLASKYRSPEASFFCLQNLADRPLDSDKDRANYLLLSSGFAKLDASDTSLTDEFHRTLGASMQGNVTMANPHYEVNFSFGNLKAIKKNKVEIPFSPTPTSTFLGRTKQYVNSPLSAVSVESRGLRGLRQTNILSQKNAWSILDYFFADNSDTLFVNIHLSLPETSQHFYEVVPYRFRIAASENPEVSWKSKGETESLNVAPPAKNLLGSLFTETAGPWMRAYGTEQKFKSKSMWIHLSAPSPMHGILPLNYRLIRTQKGLFYEIAPLGLYQNLGPTAISNRTLHATIGIHPHESTPPRDLADETRSLFSAPGLYSPRS